jgi:hypothetical protein
VDADPDTLVIALYVKIDDALQHAPELRPWRPVVGIAPRLTDAELLTLAVMQALLGYVSEARWLRYARTHLHGLVPYLPRQSGSNQRLRAAFGLLSYFVRRWPATPTCGATPCGSPTPPRSSAAAPATPPAARPWPAGLATAPAAPTPATCWGCGCTWQRSAVVAQVDIGRGVGSRLARAACRTRRPVVGTW